MVLRLFARNTSFFPLAGVQRLRHQGGQRWADLVQHISTLPADDVRSMAFTLTTRRLRRQLNLSEVVCSDPFCAACAAEVFAQFKGTEEEMIALYQKNLAEMQQSLQVMPTRRVAVAANTGMAG
jgi:uncharacterized glyoxalase superfamily metalloenzyme YdcJ